MRRVTHNFPSNVSQQSIENEAKEEEEKGRKTVSRLSLQ